jgi:hypothetical protein
MNGETVAVDGHKYLHQAVLCCGTSLA